MSPSTTTRARTHKAAAKPTEGKPAAAKASAKAAPKAAPKTAPKTAPKAGHRPVGAITFAGAGPGDPGLLTVRAAELLAAADAVLVDAEVEDTARRHVRPDVEWLSTMGTDGAPLTPAQRGRLVADTAKAGRRVVRLIAGDPLSDGPGKEEAAACARSKLTFEVVPGVAAALAVPAYTGVALTEGRRGEVRVVDVARAEETRSGADWAGLSSGSATLVLTGVADVAAVATALLDGGRTPTTPVVATHAGTTTRQHTVESTLEELAAAAKAAALPTPALLVVGDAVKTRAALSWFETKALFGWRVLVPRTKDQAGALSRRLRAHGAVPEEVPTIAVEPPRTPQQMERAIRGLVTGRYEWIAFTSANAVKAVREKFEEYGLDARAFSGIKVAAVGAQTAAAIQAFGIKPDLVPEGEQSAAGLVKEFPPYDDILDPINRVFLPRADIATETLAAGLIDLGWEVDDITAYRTVRASPPPAPVRDAIKTGGFDAAVFTSSSTVRNLVGIAGKPHASTVIACIGPQTAETAKEHGLRVDVLAPTPSMEALTEALAEFGLAERLAAQEAGEWTQRPGRARQNSRRKAR